MAPMIAGERAEDARLGAGRHRAGRRRFRKQTAIGRIWLAVGAALVRADGGQRAVEQAERAGDQRLSSRNSRHRTPGSGWRNCPSRRRRRRRSRPGRGRFARMSRAVMRLDRHMRIEAADGGGGALDLRFADIGRGMDDLALEVRQRYGVIVDDAQRADAGRREIEQELARRARRRRSPAPAHAATPPGRGRPPPASTMWRA